MPRKTVTALDGRLEELGFNEAAARCRGKPVPLHPGGERWRCFNEAAARCRGKRPRGKLTDHLRSLLQ